MPANMRQQFNKAFFDELGYLDLQAEPLNNWMHAI